MVHVRGGLLSETEHSFLHEEKALGPYRVNRNPIEGNVALKRCTTPAVTLSDLTVKGGVDLGFSTVAGTADMDRITVGHTLTMTDADIDTLRVNYATLGAFNGRHARYRTLKTDGVETRYSFHAPGLVVTQDASLRWADIGRDLNLDGGEIHRFDASKTSIERYAYLRDLKTAHLDFSDAYISCGEDEQEHRNAVFGNGLRADTATFDDAEIYGDVHLPDADIGDLYLCGAAIYGAVNLSGAYIERLFTSPEAAYELVLDQDTKIGEWYRRDIELEEILEDI